MKGRQRKRHRQTQGFITADDQDTQCICFTTALPMFDRGQRKGNNFHSNIQHTCIASAVKHLDPVMLYEYIDCKTVYDEILLEPDLLSF